MLQGCVTTLKLEANWLKEIYVWIVICKKALQRYLQTGESKGRGGWRGGGYRHRLSSAGLRQRGARGLECRTSASLSARSVTHLLLLGYNQTSDAQMSSF